MIHQRAADKRIQRDHPLGEASGNADFVGRIGRNGLPVAHALRIQHHAPLDGVFAANEHIQRLRQLLRLRLQQKAQPPEVDPQNRDVPVHIHIQRAQHRAVAAEYKEHIDRSGLRFGEIPRRFRFIAQLFDQFFPIRLKENRLDAPLAAKLCADPHGVENRRLILVQIKHRVANHAPMSSLFFSNQALPSDSCA